MNNRNGALAFDAYIGDSDFNKTIQNMNRRIESLTSTADKESRKMDSIFKNLGGLAATGLAAAGLSQLPQQIIRVRGEFQQLEIAFETMLQSKGKADKLMADVTRFAALTPYGLKDTAAATKQLLAYGEQADTVVSTLTKLGDIASGIGAPLGDIAYLYGTTMTQGRLYTQDLNQFTGRGIPMIKELSKIMGVAEKDVKGLVEAGKIGFPEVQKVIENLTKEGSMFGGLMEEQSKSLPGLIAQLGDAFDAAFNDIGKSQQGIIAEAIKGTIGLVENYQKVIDVLTVVVATYGTYRAALALTNALQSSSIVLSEAQAFLSLARGVKTAADAQALFNLVVKANPYVIAATALAALVAGYAVFGGKVSEATEAQNRMNDATTDSELAIAKETASIDLLRKQLADETKTRSEKEEILKKLIALNPTILSGITLENAATERSTLAIQDYIRAKKEQIRISTIQAQIDANLEKMSKIRSGKNDENYAPSFFERFGVYSAATGTQGQSGDPNAYLKKESQRKKDEDVKALADYNKSLMDQVNNGIEQRRKGRAKEAALVKADTRSNLEQIDEQIKALKDQQKKSADSSEYQKFEKQITALQKKREAITGGKASTVKKAATEEKEIRVKTFAEEIEERKKMYEVYERWVTQYGAEAAAEQFKTLRENGTDYLDFINTEINRLETLRDAGYAGSLNDQDKLDLDRLLGERNRLTAKESPIQVFEKRLSAAKDSAASLSEELVNLYRIQQSLDPNDFSSDSVVNKQALSERILSVQADRKKVLSEFLVDQANSEQQLFDIQTKYASLRQTLDDATADKKADSYIKALARINAAEKRDLGFVKNRNAKESEGYKELEKIIALAGKNETKVRLDTERKKLAMLKEGTDEYIEQLKKVKDAEEDHRSHSVAIWSSIGGAISELGSSLSSYGGTLGEIGGVLQGLASAAVKVKDAIGNESYVKNGKISMEGYAAAAQNVISIITGIIDANKRRREAEKQFEAERLGAENDYALSLNQNLGKAYKSNPFYQDYEGQIKAGVAQFDDAAKKYQAAIDKLEEGRAKERQKNVVDGKTTLGMVGAGAATGAIIGSVLPGVGTAVGAIVGGVVGFVGGLFSKKKKDVYGSLMEMYPELVTETAEGWAELNVEMAKALITNNQVDDKTKQMLESAIAFNEEMEKATEQIRNNMVDLTGNIGDNLKNALVEAFREGDSAAQALHKTVGDIIADVATKLLFTQLVGPVLDQLVEEMTTSLTKGDSSIVDDLARFDKYGLPAVEGYFAGLTELEKWAKANGFNDLFGRSQGQQEAMAGSIKGASEETVSALVGQANAIRIYQARMANDMNISVGHLTIIAQNTAYNKNLALLVDVVDRLDRLNTTSLRGFGL